MTATTDVLVRDKVIAELAKANREAKRQQTIVNVPLHDPSLWDQHHDWIDALLDDWLATR